MCFAPEADLVGGVMIGVIGVDVLRHVGGRREYLPLAALPMIFAVHQLVEAFVWWGLQDHVPAVVGTFATWVYLLIAFVLLPTYVPLAVMAIEPAGTRRRLIAIFAVVGVIVSTLLFAAMIRGPVTAQLADWHVDYHTGLSAGLVVVTFYIASTCGSLLFSGNRNLALFGVVNLAAIIVIAIFAINGFASLWCSWAAITSAAFALHLRLADPDGPGDAAAARPSPALGGAS